MSVISKNRESKKAWKSDSRKKLAPKEPAPDKAASEQVSLSRESRDNQSAKPKGNVSGITAGLSDYMRAAATNSPSNDSEENVRVATYNVGAGNEEAAKRENFEKTSDLLAEEIVNGETDVALLQEVGVDGRRTRGRDNNQEILEDVFLKELGDE